MSVEGAEPDTVERVRAHLAVTAQEPTPQSVAQALRAVGGLHASATVLAVVDVLRRDQQGAGPLQPLLEAEGVTDVVVNGPQAVHVDRGAGLERTEVRFADEAAVRRLAQRLAAQA